MTTVAGLIADGKVYIGADSRTTRGWEYADGVDKIMRRGDMLIGHAGDVRATQIVRYVFDIPEHPADVSDERYFVAHFVPALRKTLKDEAYASVENNQETQDSWFLVAYHGALYTIQTNYTAFKEVRPYCAIGSGSDYALGAFSATEGIAPRERITRAIRAGTTFDVCSGGDVQIAVLE